jgi:hypothetical protein
LSGDQSVAFSTAVNSRALSHVESPADTGQRMLSV